MSSDLSVLLDSAFSRHQAGDLAEASRIYHDILQKYPRQADALHMLGIIAKQQGNNELALKLIEVALGQNSDMALAWHNRSLLLRILNRKDEALQSAQQAVELDPNFADAWDMIGFMLRDKGELEKARAAHARAVALRPDDTKFLGNYALLLLATGELVEAHKIMRAIEKHNPDFMAHTMANILKAAGYTDLALPYFQKAGAQLPGHDEVRTTSAMAHLQIGDFAEGWQLWEQRPSLDPRFTAIPLWQGQPVERLMVHEDQGMGDSLQCARFIPLLRPYAKKITIRITSILKKLFEASFPDYEVLALDDPGPLPDARIRMLSLPAFFKIDATNIPTPIPYISAHDPWCMPWRERLARLPAPRVGLVWGGNPDHLNDRLRSIAYEQLNPLIEAGGRHLVSLQKGTQKNEGGLSSARIFDADPYLNDFTETAGLLAELDLLISVDTSVAHLAGAMGKPAWLMLPFDPDWRWMLGREDTPWHPSMRLFRQQQPRDWTPVIDQVAADLRRFLNGDTSVLEPIRWHGACLRRNPLAIHLPE